MKFLAAFVIFVLIVIGAVSILADLVGYVFNFSLSHLKHQKVEVSRTKCVLTAFVFGWNVALVGGAIVWIISPHWPAPTNEEPIEESVSMLYGSEVMQPI